MNRIGSWIGIVGIAALAGCTTRPEAVDPGVAGLLAVEDCADLERTVRAAALQKMNADVDAAEQIRLTGGCYSPGECAGGACGGGLLVNNTGASGASRVSTTNNQVPGVDEADFIKNDSQYIYVVSGGALRILQAWPAPATRELARVAIEGTPRKLFVWGDRALVYTSLAPSTPAMPFRECTYGYSCAFAGDGYPSKMLLFDIRDRQAPRLVRELKLSGSYVNARRIDSVVHTVISSPGVRFEGVRSYPEEPCLEGATALQIRAAFAQLRDKNTRIIKETPLLALVPSVTDTILGDPSLSNTDLLGSCRGFFRSSSSADDGTMFTTILTVDLATPRPAAAATIISRPGAVYATATAMYVAVPRTSFGQSWWTPAPETTTVHRFALDAAGASYRGSGEVQGRVLNPFAMDEHQGSLRIATTTGQLPSVDVHSTLSVLEPSGDALRIVGGVDGIAPHEDIRSVRFDGDRGFIVTFKKTDPLFVLDLHDPRRPRVLAELKVPGFSTYMQLMDAKHLLTIGYNAEDQGGFAWFSDVLLQIFDVGDPAHPQLAHREVIGTRGSSSEAQTDHLAFTYFAPRELLALPMTICEGGDPGQGGYGTMTFNGLMVYDVTPAAGFKLRGRVAHAATDASNTCYGGWPESTSTVKRSIIMDDYVFSVTAAQIKVSSLSDLGVDLVTVPIE